MGNCQKSRLCEFLHNHCRFLFFGRYQSIFDHSHHHHSSGESCHGNSSTAPNTAGHCSSTSPAHHPLSYKSTSYSASNHNYCDYQSSSRSNHYPGGSDLGSSGSDRSRSTGRYLRNNSNLAGSGGGGGGCSSGGGSASAAIKADKMHRQRSASHCPHQIRLNAEGAGGGGGGGHHGEKSPSGRKCCCPGSNAGKLGGKLGGKGSAGEGMTAEQMGRSKRASSLRILNKRFNFHFTDQSPKEPKDRRNSNSSSGAQVRQPTSATYHHGSSANHQVIYHSGNILNRSSRKAKHHHLKLNELDDRSLQSIFEFFSLRERMYYERVCRRWQTLIRTSLLAPASLKIGEHSVKCNCTCAYYPSWDLPPVKKFPRDSAGYIVYPNSLLRYLLSLCRKLKCINFSHCYLDDQALQIIMTYSDHVECLHLNDIRLEEGSDDLDLDISSPSTAATATDLQGSTSNNRTAHSSDELLSNGHVGGAGGGGGGGGHHSEETTVTSAVSAFATEQLAVFGGLMRKLSTRKPAKQKQTTDAKAMVNGDSSNLNSPTAAINQQAVKYTGGGTKSSHQQHQQQNQSASTANLHHHQNNHSGNRRVQETADLDRSLKVTRSSPSPSPAKSGSSQITNGANSKHRGSKGAVDLAMGLHHKDYPPNLSYPNITATTANAYQSPEMTSPSSNVQVISKYQQQQYQQQQQQQQYDSKYSLNETVGTTTAGTSTPLAMAMANGPASGKTSNSNIASAVTAAALSNAIGQRRAQQRRREWSRHRSSHNRTLQLLAQQQQQLAAAAAAGTTTVLPANQAGNQSDEETALSTTAIEMTTTTTATTSGHANNANNVNNNNNSSLGNEDSNSSSAAGARRHLVSPNIAPNISSLQTDRTDSDVRYTSSHSNSGGSSGEEGSSAESSNGPISHPPQAHGRHGRNYHSRNHRKHANAGHHHHKELHTTVLAGNTNNNSIDNALAISRFDDIQAFVEQEQRRRECRQSHLMHWKLFSKKFGAQIKVLSIGGLTSVDQVVIDLLLKYCVALDELRINNEIDILSYLTIIKHTVKRIYINCEHGIGLECVSLLAFRNYAEKVINLGRVDVPPELIDSVISTIGSNFSNLRSLHLRLHNADIDVATPANLLFDNLYELNLQFSTGNVDSPFKKLIQLGWSSVKSLSIQYASITEESVRAIGENLPQLKKLILHAVEFRCDHLGRRYGHRICTNCSHSVWKGIASLPHLTHLKLHRVIIDGEICKSLSRMTRLTNLDLHYCSNVSDNVVSLCTDLARRNARRRFYLNVVSRGFVTYKPPTDAHNLFIDVKMHTDAD